MRLGGLRINPVTRMSTAVNYVVNLRIRKTADTASEPLQVKGLPENPRISNLAWSPDDRKLAFTHTA
ncbi:MAG: hypothetical protein MZV63_58290 [Marinilabiliales bacterium]|nr:hypothetical protein [Marinilabiliales bacterium]